MAVWLKTHLPKKRLQYGEIRNAAREPKRAYEKQHPPSRGEAQHDQSRNTARNPREKALLKQEKGPDRPNERVTMIDH